MQKVKSKLKNNKGTWFYKGIKPSANIVSVAGDGNQCNFIGHGEYIYTTSTRKEIINTLTNKKSVTVLDSPNTKIEKEIVREYLFEKMTETNFKDISKFIAGKKDKDLTIYINKNGFVIPKICCSVKTFKKKYKEYVSKSNKK